MHQIVNYFKKLDSYSYSGHGVLMGKAAWQNSKYVLSLFGNKVSLSIRRYKAFVREGITAGKRPDLTGGGLIRSAGGWAVCRIGACQSQ